MTSGRSSSGISGRWFRTFWPASASTVCSWPLCAKSQRVMFATWKRETSRLHGRSVSASLICGRSIVVRRRNKTKSAAVYVYFIGYGDDETPIKIGKSISPERRLSEFQFACPKPLSLVATIKCIDSPSAFAVESSAKAFFSERRLRGEWFDIDWTDLARWPSALLQNKIRRPMRFTDG